MLKLISMKIILTCILSFFNMFNFSGDIVRDNYFYDQLKHVNSICVYNDGRVNVFDNTSFNFIIEELKNVFGFAREMPAIGVALHDEIKNELNSGIWVELSFDKIYSHAEMPYEKLLINVCDGWTGFNIFRCYNGRYEGRCYYVDLVNYNTSILYQKLRNI